MHKGTSSPIAACGFTTSICERNPTGHVICKIFPFEMASSVWPRLAMRKSRLMALPRLNELDNFCIAQVSVCITKLATETGSLVVRQSKH